MNKFKLALLALISAGAVGCGGAGGGAGGAANDLVNDAVGAGNQTVTDVAQTVTDTHPSSDEDPEGIIEEPVHKESGNFMNSNALLAQIIKSSDNFEKCILIRERIVKNSTT